jgi:hypothetical protein
MASRSQPPPGFEMAARAAGVQLCVASSGRRSASELWRPTRVRRLGGPRQKSRELLQFTGRMRLLAFRGAGLVR